MFKKIKSIITHPIILTVSIISICIGLVILATLEFIKIYF